MEVNIERYPFPRGKGPLISVLIPTRNRPIALSQTIDSLWSLAARKENLEFILKIDDDDKETIDVVRKIKRTPSLNLKEIVSPRGKGYADMGLWINEMAKISTGDWIFQFNDDARMKSEWWDLAIERLVIRKCWFGFWDICLLCATTVGLSHARQFCMLRRKSYEVLGHFSLSTHCDTWITRIMDFVHATVGDVTYLQVDHLEKEMKDNLRKESLAAVKVTQNSVHSIEAKTDFLADASVIVQYLRNLWRNTIWETKPTRSGWYFWDYDGGEGEVVMVDDEGNQRLIPEEGASFEVTKITKGRFTYISPIH